MSQKEQLAKLAEEFLNTARLSSRNLALARKFAEAAFLLGARAMQEKAAQKCDMWAQETKTWSATQYDTFVATAAELRALKPEELL